MSDLGDLIVEHGPYSQDLLIGAGFSGPLRWVRAADLAALRDELIELRQLRTAAATAARDQCGCLGGLLGEWSDLP